MKSIIIAIAMFTATQALALGAQEFQSVSEIQAGDVVNVTCSDITSPTQTHIQFSMIKGKFEGYLTLTAVVPAKGVSQDRYTPEQTEQIDVKFTKNKLTLQGAIQGYYFWPEIDLVIFDTKKGMRGVYSFNDNDGVMVNKRNVVCGATNYGITLN